MTTRPPGTSSGSFLAEKGFRVETAADGEEGLRLARQLRPLVITLDVVMPGMDGWAVLSALKADPELADIPVIMVTVVDEQNVAYASARPTTSPSPSTGPLRPPSSRNTRAARPPRRVLIIEDDADPPDAAGHAGEGGLGRGRVGQRARRPGAGRGGPAGA